MTPEELHGVALAQADAIRHLTLEALCDKLPPAPLGSKMATIAWLLFVFASGIGIGAAVQKQISDA